MLSMTAREPYHPVTRVILVKAYRSSQNHGAQSSMEPRNNVAMGLNVVKPAPWGEPPTGIAPGRVLMLCPPYQTTALSSLATAQLATLVREAGVECHECYLHFELAKALGPEVYKLIAGGVKGLVGEMLFAEALHPSLPNTYAAELEELLGPKHRRSELRELLERRCLGVVGEQQPTLIGMTTSCNQTLAALWLAHVIKQSYPGVCIVLGGSACAEPMGQRLLAAYPHIDYVVSGYGEEPLVALARGARPAERMLKSYSPPELDRMPLVDYTEFLAEFERFGGAKVWLSFESSRGCWWGMKNHCTFCGLNGAEMTFFEKSSARVVSEIRTLWERHGRDLFATDTIMPRKHLRQVLPELAADERGPGLFYEVKVNMSAEDLAMLRRAKVKAVQPGIESLSTRLLKLMKKGVTAIQNLALLKYCREQQIAVGWNQLCAIPGETADDYEAQIALMRLIPQLPPPEGVNPIRIDRYSPYFQRYADFGWQSIQPLAEYQSLHPQLSPEELSELAYHFKGVGGVGPDAYLSRLAQAVEEWNRRFNAGEGLYLHPVNGLVRNEAQGATRLRGGPVIERIIEVTHEPRKVVEVTKYAGCSIATLESLARQGILFIEAGRVLNLAVRVGLG